MTSAVDGQYGSTRKMMIGFGDGCHLEFRAHLRIKLGVAMGRDSWTRLVQCLIKVG